MTEPVGQFLNAVEIAAELILKSRQAVILTGAGYSTPSGIPDFRSEGSGLWARDEPLEVASLSTFRYAPEKFFAWFRPLASQIFNARPNPAHISLAELENAGYLHAVLTQNIDALHHKAGSNNVIELHGTLRTLTCIRCYHSVESGEHLRAYIDRGESPHCPQCGSILKPDVILFGEQLPQSAWFAAQRACRECDLMIVAGSSLEVLPVAGLPMQAIDRGAHLIIINQTPTYLDVRADVVFHRDVAEIIPEIAEKVLNARD